MNMSLISIVLAVYNGEKTIQETIDSVSKQTFSDFELIIINDGSNDSTLDVVSKIQDTRIKVFSYPNAGLSVSRNRGIHCAAGEFIAFLDADDLWTPDKLEAQFKALQGNPQAAVAYSWIDLIDESSQFIRSAARTRATGNVHAKLLLTNFLHTGSNPLIRKEALIQVGGFDESIFGPDDWDVFLRLAAQYHFVLVPQVQILYRLTTGSITSNISKIEAAYLQVIERAFNQAPESLQHLKSQSLAKLYLFLTFRGLEVPSGRQTSLVATRCLLYAVRYNPSLLQQRTLLIALFKIILVFLLPSGQFQELIIRVRNLKRFIAKK